VQVTEQEDQLIQLLQPPSVNLKWRNGEMFLKIALANIIIAGEKL